MSEQTKPMYWTYSPAFEGKQNFADPRIAIAKHLGWQKYSNACTEYATPEPDNYNRAIWSLLPVDCRITEDQVVYRDVARDAWITVMLIQQEDIETYENWKTIHDPLAFWQHNSPPPVKTRRYQ